MQDHKLQMLHSSKGCRHRTPPGMYSALAAIFPFDVDLAATADNALVEVDGGNNVSYLGPDHPDPKFRDAFKVRWHSLGKVGFLNPSYSLTMYSDGLKAGLKREELQWLLIESWAEKAHWESQKDFTTIGVFPYAPQTEWFRKYVMGHTADGEDVTWSGHAALDYWRLPHRVSFLDADGNPQNNSNVNTCVVHWGPNPGFVGPWVPSGRYWSYR